MWTVNTVSYNIGGDGIPTKPLLTEYLRALVEGVHITVKIEMIPKYIATKTSDNRGSLTVYGYDASLIDSIKNLNHPDDVQVVEWLGNGHIYRTVHPDGEIRYPHQDGIKEVSTADLRVVWSTVVTNLLAGLDVVLDIPSRPALWRLKNDLVIPTYILAGVYYSGVLDYTLDPKDLLSGGVASVGYGDARSKLLDMIASSTTIELNRHLRNCCIALGGK